MYVLFSLPLVCSSSSSKKADCHVTHLPVYLPWLPLWRTKLKLTRLTFKASKLLLAPCVLSSGQTHDLRSPNTCMCSECHTSVWAVLPPTMSFCSPFQPSELLLMPQSPAPMALPFADEETRPQRVVNLLYQATQPYGCGHRIHENNQHPVSTHCVETLFTESPLAE